MAASDKYNMILDALQGLLEANEMKNISVSDIAKAAGIGKGSIYYYFSSKDEMLEALVTRNYEKPIETAKNLAQQTDISPFTRMAMIFQACRNSSSALLNNKTASSGNSVQEEAYVHHKYMSHLVCEMKPVLTEIINQGIDNGEITFDSPSALAEIVLIILTVKLDNTISPGSQEEIEQTLRGLVSLLEKGTGNPQGSLNFLTAL